MKQRLRRVAWWLWYRGEGFRGYQAQEGGHRTVQAELLRAFAELGLARNPVVAGRTDRGVSARMQVLSSRVVVDTSTAALADQLNARLPQDVQVYLVRDAHDSFNAAWSAIGKEYRYHLADPGDLALLTEALSRIPGTRNFKVFHHKSSNVQERTVKSVELLPAETGVSVRFIGEGFARHMVRMLVGAASAVSHGEISLETFTLGLDAQQHFYCPTAPAEPLTLWNVAYPPEVDPFSAADRQSFPATLLR